jgi:hypothetical protein
MREFLERVKNEGGNGGATLIPARHEPAQASAIIFLSCGKRHGSRYLALRAANKGTS